MNDKNNKRVLYADPISYGNHFGFNYNNIRILSEICHLSLFVKEDYIDTGAIPIEKSFLWEKKYCWDNIPHRTRLSYFIRTACAFLHNMRRIFALDKKNHYDLIIISCVDMALFSFITRFKKNTNIAFIDHGIYLSLERKYIRLAWKRLNKRIKVCALEPYFIPYLKNNLQIKNDIFLLRHPMNYSATLKKDSHKDELLFFAPSSSNPNSFANELKEYVSFIPEGVKIVCKGNFDFEQSNLLVYSGKLSRADYDSYFQTAKAIIIPYDSSYNYRTSGVMFDSIVNRKPVLLQKGNTLEYYSKNYPDVFYSYSSIQELLDLIRKNDFEKHNSLAFDRFLKEYSDSEIKNEFVNLLTGFNNVPNC